MLNNIIFLISSYFAAVVAALAGLIGLGGAIRSTFLVAFNLPKEVYIGTSALIAFVGRY